MNREEAVQKYQEDVKEYLQNVSKRLKSGFAEGEKWFVKAVRKTVYQLYSTYEEKEKIRYLQLSLLRSRMDEDLYEMLVSFHREAYFLDPAPRMQKADISDLFAPLKAARTPLYKALRKYQGEVQKYDADRMIRETAMAAYKKQAERCRYLFRDLDLWLSESGLQAVQRLTVKWGGFEEACETVFLTDTGKKEQEQFLTYNEPNTVEQWDSRYVYQSWETAQFTDLYAEKKNLLFAVLRSCRMERCQWENCLMHGVGFRDSDLRQVTFAGCDLSGSDFRGVRMEQVTFLECNLTEADFTGTKLQDAVFTGSVMDRAVFSRDGLFCKGLDAGQLQKIRMEEEPYVF